MIQVGYTQHILNRLKHRGIPKELVEKVLSDPSEVYLDPINQTKIAVREVAEIRYMVAFTDEGNRRRAVTIHPIKERQIKNRLESGRWEKLR